MQKPTLFFILHITEIPIFFRFTLDISITLCHNIKRTTVPQQRNRLQLWSTSDNMALKYEAVIEYLQEEAVKPESRIKMPTVRELMRHFNVSLATVNRALQQLERDGTIIRRQGYGIISARTYGEVVRLDEASCSAKRTIVLAAIDYPSETVWNLTYMVEQYVRQAGCRIVNCKIHQETTPAEIIDFSRSQPDCSALLLLLPPDRLSAEVIKCFCVLPYPVILLNSLSDYQETPPNFHVFSPDPESGAEQIVAYLLRQGHRRIGYVRNEPLCDYNERHLKTISCRLKQAGCVFDSSHIFSAAIRSWEDSMLAARQITRNNLAVIRELGLTALVYTSSPGAYAAIPVLREGGFRVPEEISLIGEGDGRYFQYASPALTVTEPDYRLNCRRAVELAVSGTSPESYSCPQKLLERYSVSLNTITLGAKNGKEFYTDSASGE